ncbi:MAG: TIGR02186 family protein [Methanoregula sp.]|nr:TIGR02186 family protein [Methanoregula sp.]
MKGLHRPLFYTLCVLLVFLSGCISAEIGDARYENNGILVSLNSSSPMPDAFMQVTIYEVKGLQQQESLVVSSPVNLIPGENTVFFPARLEPGTYKLRIYLIHNGERKTAVIRDIVV